MSLINRQRMLVSGAVVLAALVPHMLLRSESGPLFGQVPPVTTPFDFAEVGDLDAALSAPIFSPTRSAPDQPAMEEAANGPTTLPVPVLVGLVSRGKQGVALVKDSAGQTTTVTPGESVDGWTLSAVGRDSATFVGHGLHHRLELDFSNEATGGEAVAADPANPQPAAPGQPPTR